MSHVIFPFPLCRMYGEKESFTYRYFHGEKIWFPVFSWFIDAGKEKILIDCPGTAGEMAQYSTLGLPIEDIRPLEDYLQEQGISMEEITTIILSHLHYDHVTGARKFPGARMIIQAKELAFARNPHPLFKKSFRESLLQGLKFEVVDGDTQILPGIDVLLTPGHTPGTQSVAVDTTEGKAIIAGFCAVRDNFFPPDPINKAFPVIPPGVNTNSLEAFDSALRIKENAAIVIPIHGEEIVLKKTIP